MKPLGAESTLDALDAMNAMLEERETMTRYCRECRDEEDGEGVHIDDVRRAEHHTAYVQCPECGRAIKQSRQVRWLMESMRKQLETQNHVVLHVERDDEMDGELLRGVETWKHRALLAERALEDIMDGVKPHEIREMTGLDDTRCAEIWNVYHNSAHPGKPLPYPATGLGEPKEIA